MIYVCQSPSTRVELPNAPGFAINPTRAMSARTAVAGNVIRQESALHASTAVAQYSREIDADLAATLETMHAANSAVTLWYRNVQYQATMSLQAFPVTLNRTRVDITFRIVRQGV